MLALVRLQAPPRYLSFVTHFDALPARPHAMHGAAVRCDGLDAVERALEWRRQHLGHQPVFPLVLVVPRDAAIARRIALESPAPAALLFEDELVDARLPEAVLETLWHGSILLRIEIAITDALGVRLDPADLALFRRLVACGADGRRTARAAVCVGMSESTLRRWLADRGLPPVGTLLRRIRLEALRSLEHAGIDRCTASRLCGWADVRASRLARRRAEGRRRVAVGVG